jgi:hypothetical protein
LLFLSANDVVFSNSSGDPWYHATTLGDDVTNNGIVPLYFRDDAVRAIGCTERYQFCNSSLPSNTSCTALGGIQQAVQSGPSLFTDEAHQAAFNWSSFAIFEMATGIAEIMGGLGVNALQARSTLASGRQFKLADNQWEVEVQTWFQITMASLQQVILEQATGPLDPAMSAFLLRPDNTEERRVCSSQKVRDAGYTSFSVLGMFIIFMIGGVVSVISFALPSVVSHLCKHRNRYASLEWTANGFLHLQSLAQKTTDRSLREDTESDYSTIHCKL